MTPEQEKLRKKAEKQIVRAMTTNKVRYSLAKDIIFTGLTGISGACLYGIPSYILTGLALIMAAETGLSIAAIRNASGNNKRLISALNNEESSTLDSIIDLESASLAGQMSKEYSPEEKQAYKETSRIWNEKPLEKQIEALAGEVNSLIGYDISVPKIERSAKLKANVLGRYDIRNRIIIIPASHNPSAITSAHEYAHHMQAVKSCSRDWFVHEFLSDGFANAIAMYAVSSYALKTGDKNMESGVICDKLHILSFYRNIFRSPKVMQPEEKKVLASYYAGTAAFLVAEQKHGRGIYRQMLDSKNPHGLLVEMVAGGRA